MNRTCLLYNYAQHYRIGIFRLLDKKLHCDFYFGDQMDDVKKINYSDLLNFKKELKNVKLWKIIYWQKGAINLFWKNYDTYIVLGEYYCISSWMILLLCKFSTRKRIYLWTHGWYGNETFLKKIVKKIFFGLSDGVFLYGNYAKELMIKEGFNEDKLYVIYNSLNYSEQVCVRQELTDNDLFIKHFSNKAPTLIFIGRLSRAKKLEQILEALVILKDRDIEVNVVFVGEGEMKDVLEEKTIKSGINKNVWFYGACYDEKEIGNLIYNSEICVSPGNVGLTAMHSLVYGTPIITHNSFCDQMPEFEAIEHGKTGYFFEKDKVHDLAEAISCWINNKRDRNDIRKNCFQIIDKQYNPEYQSFFISQILNYEKSNSKNF